MVKHSEHPRLLPRLHGRDWTLLGDGAALNRPYGVTDPYQAAGRDLDPQAATVHEGSAHALGGERFEVRARLGQPDSDDLDLTHAEGATHKVVEGDAARHYVAPRRTLGQVDAVVPADRFDRFLLDEGQRPTRSGPRRPAPPLGGVAIADHTRGVHLHLLLTLHVFGRRRAQIETGDHAIHGESFEAGPSVVNRLSRGRAVVARLPAPSEAYPPAVWVPEVPPDEEGPTAELPDDDDPPDDAAPEDEPEVPGVEPLELGGVDGVTDDGVVVVGVDGVVVVDGGGVVVDEPFGVVVSGFVVGLDGVVVDVGDVGGRSDWRPPTSPPSEVVAPAGVEPPTIPDSGFFARASTAVMEAMARPNAATVARAMFRQRRVWTRWSNRDHNASMLAPRSRRFGSGTPGSGGGAPGPRPDAIGGGPREPGGGTTQDGPRSGTSFVSSGSPPAPPAAVFDALETRAPLLTRLRTVVPGCFSADGRVSLNADGRVCRSALRVDLIEYE